MHVYQRKHVLKSIFAQSDGAVEYTDCFLQEG